MCARKESTMNFIKRNYFYLTVLLLIIILSVCSVTLTNARTKAYNELFEAYIESRELISGQTELINELTEHIQKINDKLKNNEKSDCNG